MDQARALPRSGNRVPEEWTRPELHLAMLARQQVCLETLRLASLVVDSGRSYHHASSLRSIDFTDLNGRLPVSVGRYWEPHPSRLPVT